MKTLKKQISTALAALGFIIAALSFSATPAAAAITCKPVSAGGNWPAGVYTQYCGTASATNAGDLIIATSGNGGPSIDLLRLRMQALHSASTPYNGVIYLFHNATEFTTWANAGNLPVAERPPASEIQGAAGYTFQTSATNPLPLYTVIFEHIDFNGVNVTGTNFRSVTGHEIGHWMDALLSYLKPAPAGTLPVLSNSVWFQNLVQADLNGMDLITQRCGVSPNIGLFNGLKSSWLQGPAPSFFCSGANGSGSTPNSPYNIIANTSGWLANAWPEFWDFSSHPFRPSSEHFAQSYSFINAWSDGATSPSTAYKLFENNNQNLPNKGMWKCTAAFIRYVYLNKALPTSLPGSTASSPYSCPMS